MWGKNMLTAEQARQIAGKIVQEKVESLLKAIEEAANAKKRRLRTGWDYKEDRDLWIDGGYNATKDWQEAVKILEGLGYKVKFYYKESQFVDMYILIEW